MKSDSTAQRILRWAACCGAIGVLLGALGAHGLDGVLQKRGDDPEHISKRIGQFEVGVRYHLFHSVTLLALAAIPWGTEKARRRAMRLFLAGIFLFSGSLYLIVLTDVSRFGMITPLGGLCWIAAWLSLLSLRTAE